jgi:hypothetical protein
LIKKNNIQAAKFHSFFKKRIDLMSTVPDDPNDFQGSIDTVWLSNTAYLVFVMVLGFVFLEFGAVRVKNRTHIVL